MDILWECSRTFLVGESHENFLVHDCASEWNKYERRQTEAEGTIFNFVRRPACRPAILKLTGYPRVVYANRWALISSLAPLNPEAPSRGPDEKEERGRERERERERKGCKSGEFWQLHARFRAGIPWWFILLLSINGTIILLLNQNLYQNLLSIF